jgi:hypothetical protein
LDIVHLGGWRTGGDLFVSGWKIPAPTYKVAALVRAPGRL